MVNRYIRAILIAVVLVFTIFLAVPLASVFYNAFFDDKNFSFVFFTQIFGGKNFDTIILNSFAVAVVSALVSTALAFVLAYTVNYTNTYVRYKKFISLMAMFPMLLPTITYGFAIIYSFGKKGLITSLVGRQIFDIYGFNGLVVGFVIYTVPVAYMLCSNTMKYIDKKFCVVASVMGDSRAKAFLGTVLRPMAGTLVISFVQAFFLCFTDFGIPASVGGEYKVIASSLYAEMLGSVPNFNTGSATAMVMLIPSVISVGILAVLERYNIRYKKVSVIDISENRVRDVSMALLSGGIILSMLMIFASILIVPFTKGWPYDKSLTLENAISCFLNSELKSTYIHSLVVSAVTAVVGMMIAYGAALVSARSGMGQWIKKLIDYIALVTNSVPGMVLGIAYLLTFSGTSIQNTFFILIVCNIVHYFSTPYLMFKGSLEKMNSSWEKTAMLMGDSWIKTIFRVVTPNLRSTMWEVLNYYFVNSMVTISAVVFLAGARTAVMTTKIKQLQYVAKFNEIFILSIIILFTNIVVKIIFNILSKKGEKI